MILEKEWQFGSNPRRKQQIQVQKAVGNGVDRQEDHPGKGLECCVDDAGLYPRGSRKSL